MPAFPPGRARAGRSFLPFRGFLRQATFPVFQTLHWASFQCQQQVYNCGIGNPFAAGYAHNKK